VSLEKLLFLQGVGAEFIDCFGNHIHISPHDRQGILKTMCRDLPGTTDGELPEDFIRERVLDLDARPWMLPLHSFQCSYINSPTVSIYLDKQFCGTLNFTLETETGSVFHFIPSTTQMTQVGNYHFDGVTYLHYQVHLYRDGLLETGSLSCGYHDIRLSLTLDAPEAEPNVSHYDGKLMLAPASAYRGSLGPTKKLSNRTWGVNAQLYSIRSDRQWGIGDFGDLTALIDLVSDYGADFIQLNPLHALDIALPRQASPYSPCDRRRLNPLYIQLEAIPEYQRLEERFSTTNWQVRIAEVNALQWIDYDAVYQLKYQALIMLYEEFHRQHIDPSNLRLIQYQEFVAAEGVGLQAFAQAETRNAPKALRQQADFYCYLQFLAAEQLQRCQQRAKESGMTLGLIRDLAVGAVVHGAEVQTNIDQYCRHASIGAPPDPFAPHGQNWGLTPLDPIKLKQHNFQQFISLVRANMRACGALRIDHVMALLRLWWWPLEEKLGEGAYIYYPIDTLLAILCLESQRAHCAIIGEDLGIVPPEIISKLKDAGIYSNELFYFCKDSHGFKTPQDYKPQSLMMLANHDVPTLAAWWAGSDLELRRELGLFDSGEELATAHLEREVEKQQLLALLIQQQQVAPGTQPTEFDIASLLPLLIRLVAGGNSEIFSIQISDLVLDPHPVNIPGTWKEYPNWQRRLPMSLSDMAGSIEVRQRLAAVQQARALRREQSSE